MLLDYVESTNAFTLRVLRGETPTPKELMEEYGFDMSAPASGANSALMFTREPYAAVGFADFATPTARAQLMPLIEQIEASRAEDSGWHCCCPPEKELWPFQRASVAYAMQRTNALIADQPGLGKTPQAICIANEMQARRVLVICPANIRLQWAKRIREWSLMPYPNIIYPILNGARGVHPSANWTVVSYDLARTEAIGRALAAGRYDLLILDEAHYCKTPSTGRTRAIFGGGRAKKFEPLITRADKTIALTGTPLPNRPREAYVLARGLDHGCIDWMSEDSFGERFNPSMRRTRQRADGSIAVYTDERVGRCAELQARLRANIMCRHMKRDVMPQLKLPELDIVLVEETGPIKAALKAESLLDFDPDDIDKNEVLIDGAVSAVRRQMGVAKAPLVAQYVDMLLDGGEDKVVVFGWHIEVLDIIEKELARYGVVRVDGSTSSARKQKAVDDFVSVAGKRVFLGNIQSVGTGTDGLQSACNHAVFGECSWVPGENEQALDRLDRGGQTRTVLGDFLVAPGSIDECILSRSVRKGLTIDKALN